MSFDYYNKNADDYFISTVDVDVSSIQTIFLSYLNKGMHILDAGCGSGRDSKYFIEQGYIVTAFDASEVLADRASEYLGQLVQVSLFQNFHSEKSFDAIWACASLLHVPAIDLPIVFVNLADYLKKEGVFYCSFKYGDNDSEYQGRHFTNVNEDRINHFLKNTSLLIKKLWITDDVRPERSDEKWLNLILVKK